MGRDKGLMIINGQTQIERLLAQLAWPKPAVMVACRRNGLGIPTLRVSHSLRRLEQPRPRGGHRSPPQYVQHKLSSGHPL